MKQETIEKGHELLSQISAIHKTKDHLEATSEVELSTSSQGTVIKIHQDYVPVNISVYNAPACPDILKEQINEETIRFLQRCKRHCDELEHKLKEELEDLTDEK